MSKEAEERRATAWRARHMHMQMSHVHAHVHAHVHVHVPERWCRRVHQALCGTGAVQTKRDVQGSEAGYGMQTQQGGHGRDGRDSLLLREVGRELEHGQRLACDQWGGAGEQG